MKIAVVGGGIFGCTIAVDLARAGAQVDLYEARSDILQGTTARCQARLHRGYHYPRSDSTAAAARDASELFQARYPEAMVNAPAHYYAIAPGSLTGPEDYLLFCDRLGLPYKQIDNPPRLYGVDLCVEVDENLIAVPTLARLLRRDLWAAEVTVHLGRRVEPEQLDDYDLIVMATYGQPWSRPLRYEVCEVALVELGRYSGESYVIQDGPFTSLDPYGRLYILYDVVHSVHAANVGYAPEIPPEYLDLLQRPGALTPLSNFDKMVASAGRFLAMLDPGGQGVSIHHRSMFSVRAVLPDVDATDERPTLIEQDGNIIQVLSGKICTAVATARRVTNMVFGTTA
jgi:hypothetical protein